MFIETEFVSTDVKIQAFQNLIDQLPLVHQFLLLYLLDLLSLFALTSHFTRMDIPCLASVFAPVSEKRKAKCHQRWQ